MMEQGFFDKKLGRISDEEITESLRKANEKSEIRRGMKIGQPQGMLLADFGDLIQKAFGTHSVYHVGSSLTRTTEDWRDVDVRVMLTDEEWEKLELLEPKNSHYDPKWKALCIVFSHYGKHITGLPIDFQIQRVKEANEEYKGNRSHLGNATITRTP